MSRVPRCPSVPKGRIEGKIDKVSFQQRGFTHSRACAHPHHPPTSSHIRYNDPMPPKVEYLLLGHVTRDLLPNGARIGGAVTYAALTARILGRRPAVFTSCEKRFSLSSLEGIPIARMDSKATTTFENRETPKGRVQYLRALASSLDFERIPPLWRRVEILHLAPVMNELPSTPPPDSLSYAFLGITPQGWLRRCDEEGRVHPAPWEAEALLRRADAVVLSIEDLGGDEARVRAMARAAKVLILTEGRAGARCFWNGREDHIPAPLVSEIDATGAGDIFATAFFIRYYTLRDVLRAARFAACIAAHSVTRRGIEGIPLPDEVQFCQTEDA